MVYRRFERANTLVYEVLFLACRKHVERKGLASALVLHLKAKLTHDPSACPGRALCVSIKDADAARGFWHAQHDWTTVTPDHWLHAAMTRFDDFAPWWLQVS